MNDVLTSDKTIDANFSHDFYYAYSEDFSSEQLATQLGEAYPQFHRIEGNPEDYPEGSAERDLLTVQGFLFGSGLPFACVRFLYEGSVEDDGSKLLILFSYFEDISVLRISFHRSLANLSIEDAIFVRQMGGGENPHRCFGGEPKSSREILQDFEERLGLPVCADDSSLVEITRFYDYQDIDLLEENHKKALYGLATGDEGWEFVPEKMARERLEFSWGSRSFMRFHAFNSEFLFINLVGGKQWQEYVRYQDDFAARNHRGSNPYFHLNSCPLTVNHGIMFSCEYVMAVRALTDRLLDLSVKYQEDAKLKWVGGIRRTKEYRARTLVALRRIESISISEMGELSNLLMKNMHINGNVDRVKYLHELLESELMLKYQQRENHLIVLLTVFGLLFEAIQAFTSVF